MTEKEIKAAMDKIPHGYKAYNTATEEQKREYAELSCREMINSIMIYGNVNSPYNEEEDKLDKYLEDRWKDKDSMFYVPRQRIIELVKEQQEDFKKAIVRVGVYTDSEGCTYNSCVWGDEDL